MTSPGYRPAAERLPWTPTAVAIAVALNGVAVLLLLGGWYAASGQARVDDVAPWANVSATGLVLAATGNGVLLTNGRARIGGRQRGLAQSRAARLSGPVVLLREVAVDVPVGLVGQSLFHAAACRLVVGKDAHGLDDRDLADRTPCGWCHP